MSTQLSTIPRTEGTIHSLDPRAACYRAPARFDTHVVPTFTSWLAEHTAGHVTLTVDLSRVAFIDVYAVEALRAAEASLAASGGRLTLTSMSVAARITLELLAVHPAAQAMAA